MATRRRKQLQGGNDSTGATNGGIHNDDVDAAPHRKRLPLKNLLRRFVAKISRSHRKPRSVTFLSSVAQSREADDQLLAKKVTQVVDATAMTIDGNLVVSEDMSVEVSTTKYADVELEDVPMTPLARREPEKSPSHRDVPAPLNAAPEDDNVVVAALCRRSKSLSTNFHPDLEAGKPQGKGILERLQDLLSSLVGFLAMITLKAHDFTGQAARLWHRFQEYLAIVAPKPCAGNSESVRNSKRDLDRTSVTGLTFDTNHSKTLFLNAMQNTVSHSWIANEMAEYIFSTGIRETMDAVLN